MDVRIQQRLVGALVIVALIFLIAPVMLDGEGRVPEKITQIPPKPKRPDLSHIRVAEPAEDTLAPLPDEAPAPALSQAESGTTGEDAADEDTDPAAPTASDDGSADADTGSAVPDGERAWSVQVASFRDSERAADLRDRLREAGFETYVNEVILSDGSLFTQVLVGPETEMARVQQRKAEISERLDMQGLVVRYEP